MIYSHRYLTFGIGLLLILLLAPADAMAQTCDLTCKNGIYGQSCHQWEMGDPFADQCDEYYTWDEWICSAFGGAPCRVCQVHWCDPGQAPAPIALLNAVAPSGSFVTKGSVEGQDGSLWDRCARFLVGYVSSATAPELGVFSEEPLHIVI